jgi:hypothetical protein
MFHPDFPNPVFSLLDYIGVFGLPENGKKLIQTSICLIRQADCRAEEY